MSKAYSLCGVRFGYAIANPAIIEGLIKVKDSYNVDVLAIAAATEAVMDQEWFRRNIEKVKSERERLITALNGIGFSVPRSSTNFLFASIKTPPAKEVFNKLSARNIFVRYFDVSGIDDRLRISVGTPEQNDKLIAALKKII